MTDSHGFFDKHSDDFRYVRYVVEIDHDFDLEWNVLVEHGYHLCDVHDFGYECLFGVVVGDFVCESVLALSEHTHDSESVFEW